MTLVAEGLIIPEEFYIILLLSVYAYKQYSKLYYSNFRHFTCFQSDDTRCCINI